MTDARFETAKAQDAAPCGEGCWRSLAELVWARHDAAAFGQPAAVFHLLPAVDAALDLCRQALAGVIVVRRVHPRRVLGAGGQITFVVVELLEHAALATRGTGRARVVHVDARDVAGKVRIRVSDNGLGIQARLRAARFDPGGLAAAPGARLASGLAVADAIVRAHGSELRCTERAPHGAHFEFNLRAAQHDARTHRAPRVEHGGMR